MKLSPFDLPNGFPLEWARAKEAEAGYDVEELKRRGRGRPGRGAEPMQVVAVRLTAEQLDALDQAAAKND